MASDLLVGILVGTILMGILNPYRGVYFYIRELRKQLAGAGPVVLARLGQLVEGVAAFAGGEDELLVESPGPGMRHAGAAWRGAGNCAGHRKGEKELNDRVEKARKGSRFLVIVGSKRVITRRLKKRQKA